MPRCSAAGLDLRIIPAGFNPLHQRLRGECPAGISNGVYSFMELYHTDLIGATIASQK